MKAIFLVLTLAVGTPAFGQEVLFLQTNISQPNPPNALRSRVVKINWALLQDPALHTMELNYFDDVKIIGKSFKIQWRGEGAYTWFGSQQNKESIVLTVQNHQLFHATSHSGLIYEVLPREHGDYLVIERNPTQIPREHDDVLYPQDFRTATEDPVQNLATDDGSYLDVLVLYTKNAESASGNILGWLQSAMDNTNAAFSRSNINLRIRLVYAGPTSYSEVSNPLSTDLVNLTLANDGYLDEVHALRNKFGADLVSLWVRATSGTVGIAWLNSLSTGRDSGFSVTGIYNNSVYDTSITFAHELGHNLGCHHDRANASGSGAFSYSYGYYDNGTGFGTIMSYLGFPILNFSNPDVSYASVPTGVIYTDPSSADNARTITNMKAHIASYTTTKVPLDSLSKTKFAAEGCFVATATFGSPLEHKVIVLRDFRDQYLLRTRFGSWLVDKYYQHSPWLARHIRQNEFLKVATQVALAPIIGIVEIVMEIQK